MFYSFDWILIFGQYDSRGPAVPGLEPRVASERLQYFQNLFTDKSHKWNMYTVGEELFGLPRTEYPDLGANITLQQLC